MQSSSVTSGGVKLTLILVLTQSVWILQFMNVDAFANTKNGLLPEN